MRIIDPVEIRLNNCYRLEDWEREVIRRCVNDNPSMVVVELAEMLGISDRGLTRKCEVYGISLNKKDRMINSGIYEKGNKDN